MPPTPGDTPPVPVLVNPSAGFDGKEAAQKLSDAFRDAGVAVDIRPTEPARLADEVRRAAEQGIPTLGVSGGDGSLLTASGILSGTETALAPVPTGTLNHFARRLGLDSVEAAARALAGGRTSRVPLGVVDDHIFLNTATFGLYADVVRRRERLRPWLGKWPAAAVSFAVRLVKLRVMDVALEIDGERLERRTPLVWVGLGWGSFPLVHEAPERRSHPDLEIVVLRPGGRLGVIGLLARLLFRMHHGERPLEDPALEVLHARRLLVRAGRRVGATLDGEVMHFTPPVFVAVQDEAMRVVIPAEDGSGEEEGGAG